MAVSYTHLELDLFIPPWVEALSDDHPIKSGLYQAIRENTSALHCIREVQGAVSYTHLERARDGLAVSSLSDRDARIARLQGLIEEIGKRKGEWEHGNRM